MAAPNRNSILLGFVDLELVSWHSFDGVRVPGWFALPRIPGLPVAIPAIMWVHGGPVGQTRPNFRPDIQMLLERGFAVLLPNVRGSTGYGRSYTEADDVERRLDSVTDLALMAGKSWPHIRRSTVTVSASWASRMGVHGDVGDHRTS
jgi:dipeptidyl aminopeptidase/acylaminoacyl peptidase